MSTRMRIGSGRRPAAWARPTGLGLIAAAVMAAGTATAESDDYTAGFYTRGADTGLYLDTGDPKYDPFYVSLHERLVLVPRLTLSATREDNLFLSAQDAAGSTILSVTPGLILIWGRPEGRHFYVDYGSIIRVYDSSDRLDSSPSHMLTIGGVYRTAKSQVSGRVGYRRVENADTVVGARIEKEDYIAGVGVDHRFSAKTSLGVLGNAERHKFDSSRYVDYDRIYGGGRVYVDATTRSEVFFQAGMGRDDLDSGASGFGDAEFHDLSVGVRGKPSPKTTASGRVGYVWRTYDSAAIPDVEHWIAAIYADVTPMGFSTFWSDLSADVRPAISAPGWVAIDQRWTVGVRRRMWTDRLRGQTALFLGRVDYDGPADSTRAADDDNVRAGRRDAYWGYMVGVDWWTVHNLSFGMDYSYVENHAFQGASEELQNANAYDSGRWTVRASWNY